MRQMASCIVSYPKLNDSALFISALAGYPYSPELEQKFILETPFKDDDEGDINLSSNDGVILSVPRGCASVGPQTYKGWTSGEEIAVDINHDYPPRNEIQARLIHESRTLLHAGRSHIIQASTGIGKTFVGCRLIAAIKRPTLIVVTKDDLFGEDQWGGALLKFLKLAPDDIGIIQQKKCQVEGRKVVMGIVHSLAKDKYPEWIKDYFGLVIFDEVHRMAADTFQAVCCMFKAKLRLGLSAGTSQRGLRNDGKDFIFKSHIGEVEVVGEHIAVAPKVIAVESGFTLPRKQISVKEAGKWVTKIVPLPHKPGKMMHINKMIAGNRSRNAMIIDFIEAAYNKGRNVLVLSDIVRHLEVLAEMIQVRGVPASDIGFYISKNKKNLKDDKMKRVVLGTYGMAAEATDVPQWDSLVMATPRSNVKQPIGRVLREHKGKMQPLVLDIVDNDSWVYRKYYKSRCLLYQSEEINAVMDVTF
jgi:superfamily II DNA or RNA helicase